jgi:hypothetical protein
MEARKHVKEKAEQARGRAQERLATKERNAAARNAPAAADQSWQVSICS